MTLNKRLNIRRRLAWSLYTDDMHNRREANPFFLIQLLLKWQDISLRIWIFFHNKDDNCNIEVCNTNGVVIYRSKNQYSTVRYTEGKLYEGLMPMGGAATVTEPRGECPEVATNWSTFSHGERTRNKAIPGISVGLEWYMDVRGVRNTQGSNMDHQLPLSEYAYVCDRWLLQQKEGAWYMWCRLDYPLQAHMPISSRLPGRTFQLGKQLQRGTPWNVSNPPISPHHRRVL